MPSTSKRIRLVHIDKLTVPHKWDGCCCWHKTYKMSSIPMMAHTQRLSTDAYVRRATAAHERKIKSTKIRNDGIIMLLALQRLRQRIKYQLELYDFTYGEEEGPTVYLKQPGCFNEEFHMNSICLCGGWDARRLICGCAAVLRVW